MANWSDYLTAFDSDGQHNAISQAARLFAALRSNRQPSRIVVAISAVKSLMQKREASSKDVMPVAFEFQMCVPYEGLGERAFSLRNSLLTGDEATSRFVLRIVQLEAQEAIANNSATC
ncbi:DUF2303 family protein [Salmonella enterica subsp. enterica]|nr:DUF2303 family protein [Salmonella enterica subsp. enterica]